MDVVAGSLWGIPVAAGSTSILIDEDEIVGMLAEMIILQRIDDLLAKAREQVALWEASRVA